MPKYKPQKRRAHILVAEDDRTHQCYVETMLEDMGFNATVVSNGASAVDLLQTSHYDLVLLDCNMPVMNGYEAAKKISHMKADGKIGDIPIIALTANQRFGDPEKCFESGMDGYIAKSLWLPKWKPRLERMICRWLPLSISASQEENADESVVNPVIVAKAKDMVGEKFSTLIDAFLADVKEHVDRLKQLAQLKAPAVELCVHAYALMFSCRQMGAVQMAHAAEAIMRRSSALGKQNGDSSSFLSKEIPDLEGLFEKTQQALREFAEKK